MAYTDETVNIERNKIFEHNGRIKVLPLSF